MAMLLALWALASQAHAAPLPLTPLPTFNVSNDENGLDDQPGQKDLSLQGVATPAPGDLWVKWQWDVTSLSGGNTGDACALFDTDTDSKVNFAVCVTIEGKPAVQAAASPRVYTCGDGKVDRCTSTYTQITPIDTSCTTNTSASDPFHPGDTDTVAICHVSLPDVGGSGTANLVNTCSYPSQTPTSDPSDCVLIPRDAFITIVKNATPNNTGTQFPFKLGTGAADDNPVLCTITNSGSCQTIAILSGVAYNLKEVTPTYWGIDTPAPVCTGATGSGASNGTVSGATISAIKASSDNVVTCTYNNKQLTGAIRVTKLRSGTQTTLNGAVFTIGSFTGQTTAGSGTVCKDGLPLGVSYDVTETSPPNGHSLASPATQSVTLTTAGTCTSGAVELTFSNPVVPGTINIHKTGLGGANLQGATFTLYDDNATVGGSRQDNDTITSPGKSCTTNASGLCSITGVTPRDYWLVETTTPNGYATRADISVNVPIGSSPGQGAIVNLDPVTNTAAPGRIDVHKTGFGGVPLVGAVFTLYIDNAPIGTKGLEDTNTTRTCTTDVGGDCSFLNVDPGTYLLVETTTPPGYDTADPTPVVVPLGSGPGTGATVLVAISDPVVPGTVKINKTGINGTDLNGATFTLYVNNSPFAGPRGGEDTITTKTCQTAGTGDCTISDVTPGRYWVVETTTPNGYDTAPEQEVIVGIGTVAHVGDSDELTFADPVVPGKVSITKTDDANNPLADATFTLYTDVSPFGGTRNQTNPDPITAPVKSCTTGASGLCEITGVVPGKYWVVETITPDGYVTAADQAITVGIGAAPHVGATVPVAFENVRKHRVVVLVCHEGTDSLYSRDVTIDNVTKPSLGGANLTDAQEKALCDTGGANFGDISGHGLVDAAINLGSGN